MNEQSNTDKLVENVTTYCEILESFAMASGMIPSIAQLAEEVSIVEAERQRLQEENEKLQSLVETNEKLKAEIQRLNEDIQLLYTQVDSLLQRNENQAKMLYHNDMMYDYGKNHRKSKYFIPEWESTDHALKA